MKIFAHRGASAYAPENTLEAFDLAHQQSADGVELDVHLSRDGQVIVAHDERIDRVSTGSGFIKNMTVKELKKYFFNRTHPEYEHAKVPLLEEVLTLLAPTGMMINIELKNNQVAYPGLEEKCLKLVETHGMENRVIYSSFQHSSMLTIKQIKPDAVCGLLYDCSLLNPAQYLAFSGVEALHPHYMDVLMFPEVYSVVKEKKGKINVWTVNDDRDIRRCIEFGVDILITNYPDRARAVLNSYLESQHT